MISCFSFSYYPCDRLVGDVLLLTGFLSYSGPFNQEFRTTQQKVWCKELMSRSIPFTAELNLTAMLVDNATVSVPIAYHMCYFLFHVFVSLYFCCFNKDPFVSICSARIAPARIIYVQQFSFSDS